MRMSRAICSRVTSKKEQVNKENGQRNKEAKMVAGGIQQVMMNVWGGGKVIRRRPNNLNRQNSVYTEKFLREE